MSARSGRSCPVHRYRLGPLFLQFCTLCSPLKPQACTCCSPLRSHAMWFLRADGGTDLPVPSAFRKCCRALAGRLAPSKMRKDGSTPRPPSPGRTSRSGGYLCPTADRRIAAARLHCCVSAALRGLAVGATRLRLADAGGAGAGKCLRGSAQHAYVAGRTLRRLLSGSKSSDLQRRSALRRRFAQAYCGDIHSMMPSG